ncbi:MAG: S8 family serine peptidase [Clostridia bacterium]|nr:S8 family serine peptidase [Clostridia bacterium]
MAIKYYLLIMKENAFFGRSLLYLFLFFLYFSESLARALINKYDKSGKVKGVVPMKIKKLLSLILAVLLLCGSVSASFESIAANAVSADSFAESVAELAEEEAEEGKTIEESAASRIIVKASKRPDTFGDAECIRGTNGKYIFQYADDSKVEEALAYYNSLSFVKWAEADNVVQTHSVPYGEAMLGTNRANEYIANHEISTSSVRVAIVDTGINFNHEMFQCDRVVNSGFNVSGSGIDNSAQDDMGHGSCVAEIVFNNTADNVSIIGYKVMNKSGNGTNLAVATGIEKAVEDGVDVINLSLGGAENEVVSEAVIYAIRSGITVICSAGNSKLDTVHYTPAKMSEPIVVGAIDKAGNKAYFSNYGESVDFVAPGADLESTFSDDLINGTSFSAPYVAAEAAILLSVHPEYDCNAVCEVLKRACIPYEHLRYHDGYHPITEDRGVTYHDVYENWGGFLDETPSSEALYYGDGMPQVDLAVEFGSDFERETEPNFSIDSGHYIDEEYDLEITAAPGTEIYYTQDESYPSKENGIKVDGSIHLDELQSFRAVAFSDNKAPSYFTAREYWFEYHTSPEDYTFKHMSYGNYYKAYNGTRKNIIVPSKCKGYDVECCFINTPNTQLTSISFEDGIEGITLKNNPNQVNYNNNLSTETIRVFRANSITSFHVSGNELFESLVQIDMPNLTSVGFYDNSPIREVNAPKATFISFANCPDLIKADFPLVTKLPSTSQGFKKCFSIQEINLPNLEVVDCDQAFRDCCQLEKLNIQSVKEINCQTNAFANLKKMTSLELLDLELIREKSQDQFSASSITSLYAPKLKYSGDLLGYKMEKSDFNEDTIYYKMFLSSAFEGTDVIGEGQAWNQFENRQYDYKYPLDIYGTPGTYAEAYAKVYHLRFFALPILESEPEEMGANADGTITAEVFGFNKQVQWYGTNRKDNHGGMPLSGEKSETLDTSKYNYRYYYCKVKTSDGEYKKDITTGVSDLSFYNYLKDKSINISDISLLLMHVGQTVATGNEKYDINEDGVIDIADVSILLSNDIYGMKV